MFSKDQIIKYQHLNKTKHSNIKNKYLCIFYLIFAILILWFAWDHFYYTDDSKSDQCSGSLTQNKLCKYVDENKLSGNLCMDLCIDKSLYMPQCTPFTSDSIQFYQFEKPETSIVCPSNDYVFEIKEGTSLNDLEQLIKHKLSKYLNYTVLIENLMYKLIDISDVNRDERINLQEANSLISILNNKYMLFQVLFSGKSYSSSIKSSCGGCIQIEQILNKLNLHPESLIKTVLKPWLKWPDWPFRAKISLGILDFFLDIPSLNPNDEFSSKSLYLCQSIESTFGYTFTYETKLINTDNLYSAEELEDKLSFIRCNTDTDCTYNEYCSTTCNKQTKKCTNQLQKPQIVEYCNFIRKYLLDNKNVTNILEPLLDRCESIKMFSSSTSTLYAKNDLPLSWDKHQDLILNANYWKKAREYTKLTNELRRNIWDWVRHVKDPVKNQKTTKASETTTTLAKKN